MDLIILSAQAATESFAVFVAGINGEGLLEGILVALGLSGGVATVAFLSRN